VTSSISSNMSARTPAVRPCAWCSAAARPSSRASRSWWPSAARATTTSTSRRA